MMSPTRRVAQSLATNAFVSSSLLATRSAGKSNDFFVVADLAGELHLGLAAGVVAADEHDLVAGEQVELAFGIDAIDGRRAVRVAFDVDRHRDVGHHRRADLAIERADRRFDVFVRPHVLAEAEVRAGQLVEQPAVDVVADAEGEHAGPHVVAFFAVLDDRGFARFAGGRQAVGEEQDVGGPLAVGEHAERPLEGAVDIGAAAGVEAVDEAERPRRAFRR